MPVLLRRSRRALVTASTVPILLGLLALPAVPSSLAVLTSKAKTAPGGFSTRADWVPPTVTAQVAALASDTGTGGYLREGSQFYVYANVTDTGGTPSGTASVTADVSAVATGQTAVALVAGSFSFPSAGTTYAYRSGLLTANATLAVGAFAWSIRTADQAGNVAVASFQAAVSKTYVFRGSSAHVATNCAAATAGQFDMELGYVPAGAENFRSGPGPADRVTFCSDTLPAGARIAAGTTTVTLTYQNTSASRPCLLTATLWRNSVSLGSLGRSIPFNTARTTATWSFATSASVFAAGDRLAVTIDFAAGNTCNGTTIYWNSSTAASNVVTP